METVDRHETFGDLLRENRHRAGLTQEELAERARLSVRGISDLERGLKLRPRRETVASLADALGLAAGERALLAQAGRARSTAAGRCAARADSRPGGSASGRGWPSRLPAPLTRLIGREREVAEIHARLLEGARLVTVTGTGGAGKTRLALEVAGRVAGAYADGVVFVDLAPLIHPDQVVPAIARALDLRDVAECPPREAIVEHLRPRQALLLLDNFEHVLPAAADLAALLVACPRVSALVTSRAALRLRGERLVVVPPLDLPAAPAWDRPDQIAASPAVTLFVERARDHAPGFCLTAENALDVAALCIRLDGLPLAIELAAARARLLSPRDQVARLDRRLPLLESGARDVPARQRTLHRAIRWSYDLLAAEEQALFRRFAVFVGGFTLAGAEAVAGQPGPNGDAREGPGHAGGVPVLDVLQSLVDQSLLQATPGDGDDEARFSMLETVREFGIEQLEASGEGDLVRARYRAYCVTLIRRIGPDPDEATRVDRSDRKHGGAGAAVRWARAGGDFRWIPGGRPATMD